MNIVGLILIIIGAEALLALMIMWKDILVFFVPQNYNKIIMLESDGNITAWTQKKNDSNQFKFKDGLYNMFIGDDNDS